MASSRYLWSAVELVEPCASNFVPTRVQPDAWAARRLETSHLRIQIREGRVGVQAAGHVTAALGGGAPMRLAKDQKNIAMWRGRTHEGATNTEAAISSVGTKIGTGLGFGAALGDEASCLGLPHNRARGCAPAARRTAERVMEQASTRLQPPASFWLASGRLSRSASRHPPHSPGRPGSRAPKPRASRLPRRRTSPPFPPRAPRDARRASHSPR